MTCAAPEHNGPTVEEQILELRFAGFDTAVIADALRADGIEITEARAANAVARERDRRHAVREQKSARP